MIEPLSYHLNTLLVDQIQTEHIGLLKKKPAYSSV